jgi:hypothetical protein
MSNQDPPDQRKQGKPKAKAPVDTVRLKKDMRRLQNSSAKHNNTARDLFEKAGDKPGPVARGQRDAAEISMMRRHADEREWGAKTDTLMSARKGEIPATPRKLVPKRKS